MRLGSRRVAMALMARRNKHNSSYVDRPILSSPRRKPFASACFGSPRYDRREPLHILSADSRFPDIQPGKHQSTGNHFLAMFPDPHGEVASFVRKPARARVRGGGTGTGDGGDRLGWVGSRRRPREEGSENGKKNKSSHKSKKRRRGKGDPDCEDEPSLLEKCAKGMGRFLDWVSLVDGGWS